MKRAPVIAPETRFEFFQTFIYTICICALMVAIFGELTSESILKRIQYHLVKFWGWGSTEYFLEYCTFVVNFPVIFFNMLGLSPSSLVLCLLRIMRVSAIKGLQFTFLLCWVLLFIQIFSKAVKKV